MITDNDPWIDFISKTAQCNLRQFVPSPPPEVREEINNCLITSPKIFSRPRDPDESSQLTNEHLGFAVTDSQQEYDFLWLGTALRNPTGKKEHLIINGILGAFGKEYAKQIRQYRSFKWTNATQHFPITTQYINDVLGNYFYLGFVRVMILLSGGKVLPHKDIPERRKSENEFSSYNILNSLHISVDQGEKYFFIHHNRIVPISRGDLWWMNNSKEHWAINFSSTPRTHLIVHAIPKKKLRGLILANKENNEFAKQCWPI